VAPYKRRVNYTYRVQKRGEMRMISQTSSQSENKLSKLFIVELRTSGWSVGVSHTPEERILTTIFRLNRKQKNQLHALKVKFYRLLARNSVFTIGEKYVVNMDGLVEIQRGWEEIYEEFDELRREFYEELVSNWDEIEKKIREEAKKLGFPETKIEHLKPDGENFLSMRYTPIPLNAMLSMIYKTAEDFERLKEKVREAESIAEAVKEEANQMVSQIRQSYEEKIKDLEQKLQKLKTTTKKQKKQLYKLQLRAREIATNIEDTAPILGEENVEELKDKLDALLEYFTS